MFNLFAPKDKTFENFINKCPIPIIEIDANATIINVNLACRALLVGAEIDNKANFTQYLAENERANFSSMLNDCLLNNEKNLDSRLQSSNIFSLQIQAQPELNISLNIIYLPKAETNNDKYRIFLLINDVTEQKNLELRFAHSQKMQAVGQLAGGIAHDFNNLLTAMIGFCDLLLMRHPAGDPSFADIIQVKQNANRAANLVSQLLAFSRKQTLQPKKLDLIDVISELSNLIRRLIGENIELKIHHQRDLWKIKADQGQFEQVIINLAVNARDAMPKGGILDIKTRNITITKQNGFDKTLRIPPQEDFIADGDYVVITIADSGTGIPESVIDNIFEPFFSTKEIGRGTGLGLSTVYGIIKQTGGYIYLKTGENEGTCFHIYIPRLIDMEEQATASIASSNDSQDLTGAATILLVEDETPVRIFASRALQNKGYSVIEADCGESGLEVFAANKDKIEVIITDVMMPGINGPTMIETLDEKFPQEMSKVNVVFISGYTEDAFAGGVSGKRDFQFLAKPFTLKQLAAKLKEITRSN